MTKGDHAPSDAEKQEIVAATERHKERPPRVAINMRQPENAPVQIFPTHSDGQGWDARLKDALGTTSPAFLDTELVRLLNVFCDRAGTIDGGAVNAALAVVDGLKPQNEIEAMLALQMAATHALAMKFSARLNSGAMETIPQQDSAALTLSSAAGIRNANGFPVEYAARRTAKSGCRTCPRLPGRTSDRRQCDPSRVKRADKPMQQMTNEPLPLREAPRCGARTRQGKPCQSPIVKGKRRCRMHGGAPGTGAPKGERNGNYRHGFYTAKAMAERRAVRALLRKLGDAA